jgi:hypothetical protein
MRTVGLAYSISGLSLCLEMVRLVEIVACLHKGQLPEIAGSQVVYPAVQDRASFIQPGPLNDVSFGEILYLIRDIDLTQHPLRG